MSSFKAPKVSNNSLFTPSLLLFATIFTLVLSYFSSKLVNNASNVSSMFMISSFLIGARAYVSSFDAISTYWKEKKGGVIAIVLLSFMFQLALAFSAAEYLIRYPTPSSTILYFFIASMIAVFQELTEHKVKLISWITVIAMLVFYWLVYTSAGSDIPNTGIFNSTNSVTSLILRSIAYISTGLFTFWFFQTTIEATKSS
jgi:hypothetical protein